ncbi:hypothetical protein [Tenacibaculum jejuense]|uniref:Transmembrane protein n=1 Tax=Tenacibaculum jejuense TaxID=584609 RepID=A0A238U772_9FLAO|nr:hypothetical protein [Tenacibaculum jejuense]SNR14448.1 conserved protein of unknown function [Tenacibaculum jejuense]
MSNKHEQPFKISIKPTLVNKERVYPNKGTLILKADDQFYVYDRSTILSVTSFFGFLAIGYCLFYFFGTNEPFVFRRDWFEILLIIIGLFLIIYSFTADKKKKRLILDRLNGVVTYPDFFYLPPLKGNFKDLKAVISVSGEIDGAVGREYLKFVNTFKPRKFDFLQTITYGNPNEEWSLYVWYMDKNRPLPPGTAFDPYRQKDFERRKKLGFPKPLYPSNIPTPEATKEQQKERLIIGGW